MTNQQNQNQNQNQNQKSQKDSEYRTSDRDDMNKKQAPNYNESDERSDRNAGGSSKDNNWGSQQSR